MLMTAPALYAPSEVVEEKLVTVGSVVSTTIALFAAKEPATLGLASVKTASKLEELLIVPLLSAKASVAR
jgi:hypothetical protein